MSQCYGQISSGPSLGDFNNCQEQIEKEQMFSDQNTQTDSMLEQQIQFDKDYIADDEYSAEEVLQSSSSCSTIAEGGEVEESNQNGETTENIDQSETGEQPSEDPDKGINSQTLVFNSNQILFPPPEALIQKSAMIAEPAKTGAPIAFVKLQRLYGRERIEKMNPDKVKGANRGDRTPTDIAFSATVTDYLINANSANRLIYCRFGEKYISDLEKRKNSVLSQSNQPHTNLGCASYLINIKKLIEEHNIDGDKRDFKSMKTKSMGKDSSGGPQQFYKPKGPDDKTLIFESRFESGNLLAAIKISENEYDLVLQNDINTNGHTQWFFYRVSGNLPGQKVKFNIINLAKPDSLYNYGMKLLNFSNKIKNEEGIGWHRVGENIDYYQNEFKRDGNKFSRMFYTLTFEHTFCHEDDQQFFAHCFPYTYSDLQDDLTRIEKDLYTQNFYNRSTLTRTLAGNRCEYLTITSKDKDPKSAKALAKKGVFISARVHPGESNASWMMKGVIDFLTSNSPEAKALREHFVFKIVPILNPDGVINGNYRCSLSGQDLNRRWKNPSKILHPVIFSVKKLMRSFSKERECALYVDLHGHSRRKNIFMYGNNLKEQPHATRVFPYIMSKLCDFFSFEQSRFSMSKYKESTARIAMFNELGIPNIFTMEASFCGADKGKYKDQHFTTEYLMLAGRRLLESLIVYCKIDVHQSIKQIKQNKEEVKQEQQEDQDPGEYLKINANDLEQELSKNKKLIQMTTGRDDGESSGSDSEPSADNLEEEEMAQVLPIKPPLQSKQPPPVKKLPEKKIVKQIIPPKPKSPPPVKRAVVKEIAYRSPMKKQFNNNNFDRLSLRKRKPEMKDAWTQTTPRAHDEARRQRKLLQQQKLKEQQLLMQQQQQIQGTPNQQQMLKQMQMKDRQLPTNDNSRQGSIIKNELKVLTAQSDKNRTTTDTQGNSPQPQIRVRKEQNHYKQRPSNDLAKFEERLLHVQPDQRAQQFMDRQSSKKLPEIPQSQSSQRKRPYDSVHPRDSGKLSSNQSQQRQHSRDQHNYSMSKTPIQNKSGFTMPSHHSLNNQHVQQRYNRAMEVSEMQQKQLFQSTMSNKVNRQLIPVQQSPGTFGQKIMNFDQTKISSLNNKRALNDLSQSSENKQIQRKQINAEGKSSYSVNNVTTQQQNLQQHQRQQQFKLYQQMQTQQMKQMQQSMDKKMAKTTLTFQNGLHNVSPEQIRPGVNGQVNSLPQDQLNMILLRQQHMQMAQQKNNTNPTGTPLQNK